MPIIKCKSFIDAYRYKASSRDINELSGRMGRPDLTNFINRQIINKLFIDCDDVVIDIGCGDGTLLKKSAKIMTPVGLHHHRITVFKVVFYSRFRANLGQRVGEQFPEGLDLVMLAVGIIKVAITH